MKKHLTTILSFAMMMFMAFTASFTLTSCGEEVIPGSDPKSRTVFSASPVNIGGEDGTRTFLTSDRVYLWQFDDQIWVNDGGTWVKSSDSQLAPNQKSANFYFNKPMTQPSYQVVYTGFNSTSATEVTIPKEFKTFLNGSNEIGQRGDCGVATANPTGNGTYSFSLYHMSSYLGVAPLLSSNLTKSYKWTKIVVTDVNGDPIAGTFGFTHANGIDSTSITSPSSTITLIADENATTYLQPYDSNINYNYTVVPPCHRELKITYYFVNLTNTADTMKWSRKLNARKFYENNVTLFYHTIMPDFYCWDAPATEPYDINNPNRHEVGNLTQATNSCATMPNPNELAWYIHKGDPRWDGVTKWKMNGEEYQGGVWIKKRNYITGFSSTADPSGVDRRTTFKRDNNSTTTYQSGGKPADTSQYFFLPALGIWNESNYGLTGIQGWYWSSYSGIPVASYQYEEYMGYCLNFTSSSIAVNVQRSKHGCIAGNGSDWFK